MPHKQTLRDSQNINPQIWAVLFGGTGILTIGTFIVTQFTGGSSFTRYSGIFTGSNETGTSGGLGVIADRVSGEDLLYGGWWDSIYLNGVSGRTGVFPEITNGTVISFWANNDIGVNGYTVGNDRARNYRSWEGYIAEVISVSAELTTDERQKIEGYLAHKRGLEVNLPDGHPWKDNPPTK